MGEETEIRFVQKFYELTEGIKNETTSYRCTRLGRDRRSHCPPCQHRQPRLLADLREENAEKAAQALREAGFECSTIAMDVSSRESVQAVADKAAALGEVRYVINSAGVSPSQAAP